MTIADAVLAHRQAMTNALADALREMTSLYAAMPESDPYLVEKARAALARYNVTRKETL